MRKVIVCLVAVAFTGLFASRVIAAEPTTKKTTTTHVAKATTGCKWTDEAKLKTHLETHVTYPATGQTLKDACKKEMPEEFTKDEHACFDGKIDSKKEYKSATEVLTALGVKA